MDANVASAFIQALASLAAALGAVLLALALVRRHELSRARVDCVRRIFAFRFVLRADALPEDPSMAQYLAALNEVPFLFASFPGVLAAYRDALANGHSPDALANLIRALSPHVAVDFQALSNDDIKTIFLAPRTQSEARGGRNVAQ